MFVRDILFYFYHKLRERKVKALTRNWRDHKRTGTHKHMETVSRYFDARPSFSIGRNVEMYGYSITCPLTLTKSLPAILNLLTNSFYLLDSVLALISDNFPFFFAPSSRGSYSKLSPGAIFNMCLSSRNLFIFSAWVSPFCFYYYEVIMFLTYSMITVAHLFMYGGIFNHIVWPMPTKKHEKFRYGYIKKNLGSEK